MANIELALKHTLEEEGGYVFDKDDPGGETYFGVARVSNPKWEGWSIVDALKKQPKFPRSLDTHVRLHELIVILYRKNYWDLVRGDELTNQSVAEAIFDFAVNAGPATSIKMAQMAVDMEPTGKLDQYTIDQINEAPVRMFLAVFTIHKIARYIAICKNRPVSKKYLYGWIIRALKGFKNA